MVECFDRQKDQASVNQLARPLLVSGFHCTLVLMPEKIPALRWP